MTLIDANVILRYLLEDHAEMRDRAEAMIESGECFTLPEVIAEVVYVLSSYYQVERAVIRDTLVKLFKKVSVDHPEVMEAALDYYAGRNVDFVDGILIARAKLLGETVFTFDKRVNKLISIK